MISVYEHVLLQYTPTTVTLVFDTRAIDKLPSESGEMLEESLHLGPIRQGMLGREMQCSHGDCGLLSTDTSLVLIPAFVKRHLPRSPPHAIYYTTLPTLPTSLQSHILEHITTACV